MLRLLSIPRYFRYFKRVYMPYFSPRRYFSRAKRLLTWSVRDLTIF